MIGVLGVTSAGYYKYRNRPMPSAKLRRECLTALIKEVHVESRGVYGSRRVHAELTKGRGVYVRERLSVVLIHSAGIVSCPGPAKVTRNKMISTSDDLVDRQFAHGRHRRAPKPSIPVIHTWEEHPQSTPGALPMKTPEIMGITFGINPDSRSILPPGEKGDIVKRSALIAVIAMSLIGIMPSTSGASTTSFGKIVKDGDFSFRPSHLVCNIRSVGSSFEVTKATGQYCRISIWMYNHSKNSGDFIDVTAEIAVDKKGRQYEGDIDADSSGNPHVNDGLGLDLMSLNPGLSVTGYLYFDMPKGDVPSYFIFHDSSFSGGVKEKA